MLIGAQLAGKTVRISGTGTRVRWAIAKTFSTSKFSIDRLHQVLLRAVQIEKEGEKP